MIRSVTVVLAVLLHAAPMSADDVTVGEAFGLEYRVYGPTAPRRGMPLVVFLHGCTGRGGSDEGGSSEPPQAERFGWTALARAAGFLLLVPEAPADEPVPRCWFFNDPPGNSVRGSGHAHRLASLTRKVMRERRVDDRRVYLQGYSAGGTMASVMGATYPDLYAAIATVEGCPYRCVDDSGHLAYEAMGEHRRRMPVFIVTGTAGGYVAGGEGALHQWLGTNDLVDDGEMNLSVPRRPVESTTRTSGRGLPYVIERYDDRRGAELIVRWVVHGMYHEYPEPGGDLPDATAGTYSFFAAHPRS